MDERKIIVIGTGKNPNIEYHHTDGGIIDVFRDNNVSETIDTILDNFRETVRKVFEDFNERVMSISEMIREFLCDDGSKYIKVYDYSKRDIYINYINRILKIFNNSIMLNKYMKFILSHYVKR